MCMYVYPSLFVRQSLYNATMDKEVPAYKEYGLIIYKNIAYPRDIVTRIKLLIQWNVIQF